MIAVTLWGVWGGLALVLAAVWLVVLVWVWSLVVEPGLSRPRETFARPVPRRPAALMPARRAMPPTVVIDVDSRPKP